MQHSSQNSSHLAEVAIDVTQLPVTRCRVDCPGYSAKHVNPFRAKAVEAGHEARNLGRGVAGAEVNGDTTCRVGADQGVLSDPRAVDAQVRFQRLT